ncbi:MAG TPA: Ig-like domain-containing protein [Terriglobales bacterium]|nr:Ig-like domain-containing protein [Terriglobales bacterium]
MMQKKIVAVFCLFLLWTFLSSGMAAAQDANLSLSTFSLGDRILCQTAIEQVYWRHRTGATPGVSSRSSFEQAVPADLIQRKAEDVIFQSAALQRFWGVHITGDQLQAELNRMVANSKAPDVLAELFSALDNDPLKAAECLARPLLVDRLIQSYYSADERFHGVLKSKASAEAASRPLASSGGQYKEVEWSRGRQTASSRAAVVMTPSDFDQRVADLKRSFGGASGKLAAGDVSGLREDANRFYAVSILALDHSTVRIATVEWPKVPFEGWWTTTRSQLPMAFDTTPFDYTLPAVAPNANCRDDSWKPTLQLLDPRYFHTAVWTGTEMIVWGGMSSVGTIYNDGSRYNPATDTWTLVTTKGAPSAREAHVAVWTGKEMVVFGATGDQTGGRYNPVTDTWRATNTAGAPVGQGYSAVVWTGKEMIVWGGILFSPVNAGGRYNPQTDTWTVLPPAPLAARAYTPAVWTGSEMLVWAGYDVSIGQLYGDGARYNPTTNTWTMISSTGAPNARYWHTAVWSGTEMIVWGGINYPSYDLSGGRYNPATNTWTPTSLVNPPALRWLHAAVWTGKEMVIAGGTPSNPAGGRYNPLTDSWTATNSVNAANNGQGITAVWTGKEMILWGGLDDKFVFHNDGGRYNPTTDSWLRTTTMNVPQARGLHSAEWTGSEMVIWGGFSSGVSAPGGRYDPATDSWKTVSTVGAPAGRENATNVWTGTEVIFWGGDPDGNPFTPGTGGRYNPVTDTWKLTTKANAPFNTYGHTAVWTGTEMIVYGGISSSLNAKRYNPSTNTWADATLTNDPGHRDHHGAVWSGTEMIIWGGSIDNGYVGPEGGRYNPTTNTWTLMSPSGLDALRMWPVSVWTGTETIVWGGYNLLFGKFFNDGARYNPISNTWIKTRVAGAPSPRITQGVWSGTEMLTWGGSFDSSGGRYNPATDSWKPTTKVNAPFERAGGRWSTVWTGSQMIIWGGINDTQQGNLYCASGVPNSAPVAVNDNYTVLSNKQLVVGVKSSVLLNDTDANGDLLSAKGISKTIHGTVQFNSNGSFTYKPTTGYVGPDSFTYQANDGVANSNTATVTITVQ